MTDLEKSVCLGLLQEIFTGHGALVGVFGEVEGNRAKARICGGVRVTSNDKLMSH